MLFPSIFLLTAPALISAAALPNSTPNPTTHSLFGRDEALNFLGCGPSDAVPCSLKNAQACVNYMIAAGETMCNANEENYTVFCAIDKCRLVGQAVGAASASSYCKDVGFGAQAIVDKCKNSGKVKGHNTAGGNGNMGLQFRADLP